MENAPHHNEYAFRNSSNEAPIQLSHLEAFLDPTTIAAFESIEVPSGSACLELGAGNGSIAHWLADRIGDDGTVTAIDINPVHIPPRPNLRIMQHDLRQGLPVAGPFDVIHARLVLSHIAERTEILKSLVELLAPGGWLVVGEFVRDPVQVISAASDADAALYVKVYDATYDGLINLHGADLRFGFDVFNLMTTAGLATVRSTHFAESWSGDSYAAKFLHSNSFQLEELIRGSGVTAAELDAYRRLVFDPALTVKSNLFVNTVGKKPCTPT